MDAEGNIYEAPEDQIPAEDKARLDGYLKAKAEEAMLLAARLRADEALYGFSAMNSDGSRVDPTKIKPAS